jgi:hypothetical protein
MVVGKISTHQIKEGRVDKLVTDNVQIDEKQAAARPEVLSVPREWDCRTASARRQAANEGKPMTVQTDC